MIGRKFILAALLGTVAVNTTAQIVIARGYCGKQGSSLIWTLTSDSVLTIGGSGNLADFFDPMPLWNILSFKNASFANSLEPTNYFYETAQFEDVDPALIFTPKLHCADDPLFCEFWGLHSDMGIETKKLFFSYNINRV
jgi:hypothetical protein